MTTASRLQSIRSSPEGPPAERARILTNAIVNIAKPFLDLHYDANFEFITRAERRPGVPAQQLAEAIEQIDEIMTHGPTPIPVVIAVLTKLKLVTAGQRLEDADWRATLRAYSEVLSRYPPDLIAEACTGHRWWPPLADLVERCRRHEIVREILREALRETRRSEITDAPWTPPTEEDKAYVDSMLAKWRCGASEPEG